MQRHSPSDYMKVNKFIISHCIAIILMPIQILFNY